MPSRSGTPSSRLSPTSSAVRLAHSIPFGGPVVPDVYRIATGSSACTECQRAANENPAGASTSLRAGSRPSPLSSATTRETACSTS
jgi:hypothetical protein